MDFCKFIKIGPFYLYLSTRRLKGRGKHDDLLRNKRKKLLRLKNRIYKMNGGLCEGCGRPFFCEEMEVHHIVPVSENPRLITAFSNLQVVCPECHAKIHGRPVGGVIPCGGKPRSANTNEKKIRNFLCRLRIFLYFCSQE